jgi:predicted AAA+ superfamily ATPase
VTLIGPRRAGKTSVCYQLIKNLRATMPTDRLLYVNFEDDRFFPAELTDMDMLLEAYYAMYPANKESLVYFFFDEVQEVPQWEKFVRRLSDQENCRIYLTGSSSKLLSQELATALRGRTLTYEIFPLSFAEFLRFNHTGYDNDSSKGRAVLQHQLQAYMRQGGFPELVFLEEPFHRPTINEYINLMIYKDLMERFSLRNPHLLKYLLKYYLVNMANPLSINRVYNDLRSQGYALSKNTVYEYTSYLEEAFVVFRVSRWSTSVRQQAINPDKLYVVDQAFKYAMSDADDEGRILENMVFMALRRLGLMPDYFMDKQEVDFYVPEKLLINVCLDLSGPATRQRELSGLEAAMRQTGLDTALLVTLHEEGEERLDAGKVRVVTARDFLLKPEGFVAG